MGQDVALILHVLQHQGSPSSPPPPPPRVAELEGFPSPPDYLVMSPGTFPPPPSLPQVRRGVVKGGGRGGRRLMCVGVGGCVCGRVTGVRGRMVVAM